MTTLQRPTQNRLLDALPPGTLARLMPHLEQVALSPGEFLYDAGDQLKCVYFPTTGFVSLVKVMANGQVAEIAVVGNEGMLGISTFIGDGITPSRAVVQGEGFGYRLDQRILMKEFNRDGSVLRILLRYTQLVIARMAQAAACNRYHSIEHQLCRLLLERLDRSPTVTLKATQGQIATILGARREGITEAAARLQRAGLIHTHRGTITVLDRRGLEKAACECYKVVRSAYKRLFKDSPRGKRLRVTG